MSPTPAISPFWFKWFTRYARRFVTKNFHAVRLAKAGRCEGPVDRPWVVYLNHPAWWDPMIGVALATTLFPQRKHYVVIEAAMLRKYKIFEKVGFFGVEPDSVRGGLTFLRTSKALLERPESTLWITGEGAFTDPRVRPTVIKPGVGHLARHAPAAAFIPLALEYAFWDERFPESLCAFGSPTVPDLEGGRPAAEWTALLAGRLESTQDRLARAAMGRKEEDFQTLLAGGVGIGGIYDFLRKAGATVRGEKFTAGHRES